MDDQARKKMLVFSLDEQLYAFPLPVVSKVVSIVEISKVPGLPTYISGVVNVHGVMLPVISLRKVLKMKERITRLDDQMIIVVLSGYSYVLHVDNYTEVIEISSAPESTVIHADNHKMFFEGAIQLKQGIVLVCNPAAFLSKPSFDLLEEVINKVNL